METKDFLETALSLISPAKLVDGKLVADTSESYVVWYCKTLQNHKALLSAKPSGYPYYEVTYNGDTKEFYVVGYKKDSHETLVIDEDGDLIDKDLVGLDKEELLEDVEKGGVLEEFFNKSE